MACFRAFVSFAATMIFFVIHQRTHDDDLYRPRLAIPPSSDTVLLHSEIHILDPPSIIAWCVWLFAGRDGGCKLGYGVS
jgi:uncharacterized membrane protein SirB2